METKYYYENTSRNDGHCIEMELRYEEPRLVFRPVQGKPLILEYALAYYPDCFTLTGINDHHLTDIRQWCADNDCGHLPDGFDPWYHIVFRSEKEIAWFLLRWE